MLKQCRKCGESKPPAEMKKDTRYRDGLSSYCKKCHQVATIRWQKNNPVRVNVVKKQRYARKREEINAVRRNRYDTEKARWNNLKRLYRVSREWYELQILKQNGRCAICGTDAENSKRKMAVDHDHSCCTKTPTCGKCNRGILCHPCNMALHLVERDRDWMHTATRYLDRYGGDK
jgi:hypothetical protein